MESLGFCPLDSLSGWKGTFLAKEKRRVWNEGPLCIFWTVWKTRNGIVFRDEVLSILRLKSLFVYIFWLETKVSIVDGPMFISLIGREVRFFEALCSFFRFFL